MDDSKGRRVRRWNSLEEELEALENNPTAQALLRDLEQQDPERVQRLVTELREDAMLEETEP
jgi:hypothetical protein